MKTITVIGTGYVGLVAGTCFADLGHEVRCIDIDEHRIALLNDGVMPIYEPGLEEMVRRNHASGRLQFTTSYEEGLAGSEVAFICVDTPSGATGEADLKYIRSAAEMIARVIDHPITIVNRSTVPIGTGDVVAQIVRKTATSAAPFSVVSNPEFLREGSAILDFMNPDRIVLGSTDPEAAELVAQLYLPLRAPIMITDLRTAEMIKYASNAFLATKISFINEIAAVCEKVGADIKEVAEGMGYDQRIGPQFLNAGLGWGGSCFPKDVQALEHTASIHGCHPQLLRAVMEINRDQRLRVILKLHDILGSLSGKTIGMWGLAFKPNTDDMRGAPSLDLLHMMKGEGAHVRAYDPVSMDRARGLVSDVELVDDAYAAARGADALVVVTEWNEFKNIDLPRVRNEMRRPVLIDGRNIYDPVRMDALGFTYRGVGRGYGGSGARGDASGSNGAWRPVGAEGDDHTAAGHESKPAAVPDAAVGRQSEPAAVADATAVHESAPAAVADATAVHESAPAAVADASAGHESESAAVADGADARPRDETADGDDA